MRIQNNITAANSHRQQGINSRNRGKVTERLSSGLRINRAADDAAGLAISEKMRAQVRGLNQASRNVQDGISLVQTAEGGMQTVQDIVHRIRELVVQAANDTNDQLDRGALQLEIDQLILEIDDIAATTEFNGRALLTGNYARLEGIDLAALGLSEDTINALTAGTALSADAPLSVQAVAPPLAPTPPLPSDYTTINASDLANLTGNGWTFDPALGTLHITGDFPVRINGAGMDALNRITVEDGASTDIILNNVNITTGTAALELGPENAGTAVNLWLEGTNMLQSNVVGHAGVSVTAGNTLTINGSGSLSAIAATGTTHNVAGGTGIGGGAAHRGAGNITIFGGNITAQGGPESSGIGGSWSGSGGNVVIVGGTVNATGGIHCGGSGIGAGCGSSAGTLTVFGGTVNVARGISGGGMAGNAVRGANLTVHGGELIASQGNITSPTTVNGGTLAMQNGTMTGSVVLNGGLLELYEPSRITGPTQVNGGNLSVYTVRVYDPVGTPPNQVWPPQLAPSTGNHLPRLGPPAIPNNITSATFSGQNVWRVRIMPHVSDEFGTFTPNSPVVLNLNVPGHGTVEINAMTDSSGRLFVYLPMSSDGTTIASMSVGGTPLNITNTMFGPSPMSPDHHRNRIVAQVNNSNVPAFTNDSSWDHSDSPGGTTLLLGPVLPEPPDHGPSFPDEDPQHGGLIIQSGANQGQILRVFIEAMSSWGIGLRSAEGNPHFIDVSRGTNPPPTALEISALLGLLDESLNRVSMARADLGAMQNRMEFKMQNLNNQAENVAAAESRIRDADMALEMTSFTRKNILSQASTAMLAQANALPQGVLQLLG